MSSRNNLSDSLNSRLNAFVENHHNRPLHYVIRAFLAREDCTLSVEDVMQVFDSIPQRAGTTRLRDQKGRVSGVMNDCDEYDAAIIESASINRQVTHYILKNPEQFSNTGFSLIENHVTNRGRFKKYFSRELYDAIASERLNRQMTENEVIVSETVSLAEFESHLPKIVIASEEVSIPETLLITDESSDSTLSDSDVLQEFALDASDAQRKFKRRAATRKSVESDASESVAA